MGTAMTSSPPPNLSPEHARLWELAEKATPGKRVREITPDYALVLGEDSFQAQVARDIDADFLVATDRDTILSLFTSHATALAENEQLKAQVAVIRAAVYAVTIGIDLLDFTGGDEQQTRRFRKVFAELSNTAHVDNLPAAAIAYMERVRKAEDEVAQLRENEVAVKEANEVLLQAWDALKERADRAESDLAAARLALDPFASVYRLNEPLANAWPDDMPARDIIPGAWPTWADLRNAEQAIRPTTPAQDAPHV